MFSLINFKNTTSYEVISSKRVSKIFQNECTVKCASGSFLAQIIRTSDDKNSLSHLKIKCEDSASRKDNHSLNEAQSIPTKISKEINKPSVGAKRKASISSKRCNESQKKTTDENINSQADLIYNNFKIMLQKNNPIYSSSSSLSSTSSSSSSSSSSSYSSSSSSYSSSSSSSSYSSSSLSSSSSLNLKISFAKKKPQTSLTPNNTCKALQSENCLKIADSPVSSYCSNQLFPVNTRSRNKQINKKETKLPFIEKKGIVNEYNSKLTPQKCVSLNSSPNSETSFANIEPQTSYTPKKKVTNLQCENSFKNKSSNNSLSLINTTSTNGTFCINQTNLSFIENHIDSDLTFIENSNLDTVPHNSTEKDSLSQVNITQNTTTTNDELRFTHNSTENGSLSEYLPDSTIDITIPNESSNLNSTCTQEMQQSVNEITSPVEITKVKVPYSAKTKKHFCVFCKTLQTKIARHLLLKHKNENEIKTILKLPKKHKDRLNIINKIRKDGDFLHNTTKSLNSGILIVSRQQQTKRNNDAKNYVCCKYCKGFYSKKTLRLHINKCGSSSKNVRTNISSSKRLTQYIHVDANEILKCKIFPILRDDKITSVIQYDELIIKYGNKLADKYTSVHQHDMIRSHLRLLGRFKIAIKELCPEVEEFKDIFKPQMFNSCVKALRKVANWDKDLMWFKTPAVAQHLTSLIKKCGYKHRTELIKIQDDVLKKNLEDFLLLWEEEIPTVINKKAFEDQANQKRDKKVVLPSKDDIKKLYLFLKGKIIKEIEILENAFSYESWLELIKATLIFIQILNRRRPGEIERLTLPNYYNKENIIDNLEEEILKNISKESIEFAKQFVRLTIRGKLGRTVSVLLSPLCISAIELIIKYRETAGITTTNEYIFCKKVSSKLSKKYFRACPLLKQFSVECGAVLPESLRGTTLRKHIATYTSLLNIEEASVDRLANFMGHHKDIHKNVYRMSVPVAEITCVSKLLMNAIIDENDEDDEICGTVVEDVEINTQNNNTDPNILNISEQSMVSDKISKKKKRSTSPYGKTKRSRWTQEERDAITSYFGSLKVMERLPSLADCLQATNQFSVLKNRTPQQIKSWIDNQRRYK